MTAFFDRLLVLLSLPVLMAAVWLLEKWVEWREFRRARDQVRDYKNINKEEF